MNYLGFIQDYCEMHKLNIKHAVNSNLHQPRFSCKVLYSLLRDKGVSHVDTLKLMVISESEFESFNRLENDRCNITEYTSDKAKLRHEILWLNNLTAYATEEWKANIHSTNWEEYLQKSNNAQNKLRNAKMKLRNLECNLPILGMPDTLTPIKLNYGAIKD